MAEKSPLTVEVWSFSYKQALPPSPGDHGGGFVFDCRCVPNPGREPELANLTGFDAPVQRYLQRSEEAASFERSVHALVDQAVANYLKRGFSSLFVSFGCTGGQHRSVYFAHRLADRLRAVPNLTVVERHREQERVGSFTPVGASPQ